MERLAVLLDLDDTLYDEGAYLRSGFAVVAERIATIANHPPEEVLATLIATEARDGRGRVFDTVLRGYGIDAAPEVIGELVELYREHRPRIALHPGVPELLMRLRKHRRVAIVTDGQPRMQRLKVAALGLERAVHTVVYTWEIAAPKPDPRGFEAALASIGAAAGHSVVIGDNPHHDMRAAQTIGARAIRIRAGRFAAIATPRNLKPDRELANINGIETALERLDTAAAISAKGATSHA